MFSGLSLLGNYPAGQMPYYHGLPGITWCGLGATGFWLLVLFILTVRKEKS